MEDLDGTVWVDIGELGKTHGLRGEISVHPYCEDPKRFSPGAEVYLLQREDRSKLKVATSRQMPKKMVIRFEGHQRIEDVESLVGATLQIQAGALPSLGEDENYHYELIGLKVYRSSGEYVGILEEILSTAGNDVYCVRQTGRETLIPAIRDAIERIDLEAGTVTLKELKGLIEP
jgi:16S rRNA processing protein RimM